MNMAIHLPAETACKAPLQLRWTAHKPERERAQLQQSAVRRRSDTAAGTVDQISEAQVLHCWRCQRMHVPQNRYHEGTLDCAKRAGIRPSSP
jgi:hypothetical protein